MAPCLSTPAERVPARKHWVHEIKYDGYRSQLQLRRGQVRICTRRGHDWTGTFSQVAEAAARLPARSAILDSEIVVLDERGLPDFHALQEALAQRRPDRFTCFVFDLLYLDGFDLRDCALVERKRLLSSLVGAAPPGARIRVSEHLAVDAREMLEHACAMHLEGIISKERDSPYRSGRQQSWLKLKCHRSDTFPIVAFVEKLGAKPRRVASLYLGRWEDGQLLYAGKAQSGFTQQALHDLRERLDPYIRRTSPLSVPVKKPKATWVEPVLPAEIEYGSVTSSGVLRAAVYKGLRDDLSPTPPPPRSTSQRRSRPRVPAENILQWLPDAVVPSREELAAYWKRVAPKALKYLARRPLKLVRHLRDTTFYHRGPLPPVPASVHQLRVKRREGGTGTRLWVDDLAGLLGLVEIGAVELHPWNSQVDVLEHPDVLVFDLDPGRGIPWAFVTETALALRELLKAEGWDCWPKLTGGKGLHIMVPIASSGMTHDLAHDYSRTLAAKLAARDKIRYTLSAAIANRSGRLFIDYLRNGRGTTAVGAYSPRARPAQPIAAPVTWRRVENGVAPDAFTLQRPFTAVRAPSRPVK